MFLQSNKMSSSTRKQFVCDAREISLKRVLKIQECLSSEKFNADCLLIITGIDSSFNIGSKNALDSILPGLVDIATRSASSSEDLAEDALDDLVICIKRGSIHVYCNPENYGFFMSYAACWKNLHVHCLDHVECENHEELSEDLKISSLLAMVENCQHVAIPYNYGIALKYQSIPFDPMLVEKWPLIQAFGLEEIGGGGFFTMKHEVIDATTLLREAFSTFDTLGLEFLFTKHLPQFEQQWKSLIDNVSMVCDQDIGNLESSMVAEPLKTYFHHAAVLTENSNVSEPSVMFGIDTCREHSEKSEDEKRILKESGIDGSHAYHMICEGKDSKGIISCTRTYLFEPTSGTIEEDANKDESSMKEVRILADWYQLTVEAFDLAVKQFSRNLNLAKCKGIITDYVMRTSKERTFSFKPKESDIEVTWHSVDQNGSERDSLNGTCKNIKITIHNIPSIKNQGKTLGSVCFSDTFMTSVIQLKDSQGSMNTECLFLTSEIPRFASWTIGKRDSIAKDVKNAMFGNCLIENATAVLIHGCWPTFHTDEVIFYGFVNYLVLHHKQNGYIFIKSDLIEQWTAFDDDSTRSITLLTIKPNEKLLKTLPFWLSKDCRIMIAFLPRSKAHAGFYDKAFHVWRDLENRPLRIRADLPNEQKMIYACVQEKFKSLEEKLLPFALKLNVFPNLNTFYRHFELSTYASQPIDRRDLRVILSQKEDENEEQPPIDDSEILLTILTGLPGSGSETLCKALVSLAREGSRWLTIKVPNDVKVKFNPVSFQDQLSLTYQTVSRQRGRPIASSRKRRRVIIQTQGFVDIRDVIRAIEEHPDSTVQKKLTIGSVTCCINPNNFYLRGRMQVPLVLEQCSSGFVNNALFTGCTEPEKADILSDCQKIIRNCNPDVSFLIAKGGEISRSPDVELILSEDAFRGYKALKTRTMFSWKGNAHFENFLNEITISLRKPLDKKRFLFSLKQIKGKMSMDCQLQDIELYMEGKVSFIDSSDVYEFKWSRLLGMTSFHLLNNQLLPRPPSSKKDSSVGEKAKESCVTFIGLKINEVKIKELMQTWARQRKPIFKREDITKDKLNELERSHKSDPLPPGWFYNGSQYVNFEGQKLFKHPFDKHVEDYIAAMNKNIKSFNDEIADEDIFAI